MDSFLWMFEGLKLVYNCHEGSYRNSLVVHLINAAPWAWLSYPFGALRSSARLDRSALKFSRARISFARADEAQAPLPDSLRALLLLDLSVNTATKGACSKRDFCSRMRLHYCIYTMCSVKFSTQPTFGTVASSPAPFLWCLLLRQNTPTLLCSATLTTPTY